MQPPWIKAASQSPVQPLPADPAPLTTQSTPTAITSSPSFQNAIVGGGATVLTNVLTSGLTGDPDIIKIGAGLNVLAQGVKQWSKFNEKEWMIWFLIIAGVSMCCWMYRDPAHWDLTHFWMPGYLDIPAKGIMNGLTGALQALSNYSTLAPTGVSPMTPVPFEKSVESRG